MSYIDPGVPVYGEPTTESVRDNFQIAKDEIEALQAFQATAGNGPFLPLVGGTLSGLLTLAGPPGAPLDAATKGYVDGKTTGSLTDAPSDTFSYGRVNAAWGRVLPLAGGTLTGALAGTVITASSTIQSNSGRVIAQGSNLPSLTASHTAGFAVGMWSDAAGTMGLGWCDNTGLPTGSVVTIRRSDGMLITGQITANGTVGMASQSSVRNDGSGYSQLIMLGGNQWNVGPEPTGAFRFFNANTGVTARFDANAQLLCAGVNSSGSIYVGGTTAYSLTEDAQWRYIVFGSPWALEWNKATGDYSFTNNSGHWLYMRVSDKLIYGNQSSLGGFGAYVNLSDERAKLDIEPASIGLDEILKIKPIRFRRVSRGAPDAVEVGFSAQQLQDALPDAVRVAGFELPDGSGGLDSDNPTLGVTDTTIVAALVNAVQQLTARIAQLEGKH